MAGDWKQHLCPWRGDGIHQSWSKSTSECRVAAKGVQGSPRAGRETPGVVWHETRVGQCSASRIPAVRPHIREVNRETHRREWSCMWETQSLRDTHQTTHHGHLWGWDVHVSSTLVDASIFYKVSVCMCVYLHVCLYNICAFLRMWVHTIVSCADVCCVTCICMYVCECIVLMCVCLCSRPFPRLHGSYSSCGWSHLHQTPNLLWTPVPVTQPLCCGCITCGHDLIVEF